MLINDLRKTSAYKICGYMFYLYIMGTLLYGLIWNRPELLLLFFFMSGFVVIPFVLFPVFVILTIIGIATRKKFSEAKYNIPADIGYILTILLFITALVFGISEYLRIH